jgi:ribosome-interacting GTPase 1
LSDKEALKRKLDELEKEYSGTKYNKATNKHLGILRAKISDIKEQMDKKSGKKGQGFSIKKSGNATVCMVGFPNAGKSSTLNALTGVESKVAGYAFTTLDVIPGSLGYKGATIQIFDLPGIVEEAHEGKGRGREIISVMRSADLILFVVDINDYNGVFKLIEELKLGKIRVNSKRPLIRVEKKPSGGVAISSSFGKVPSREKILDSLNRHKIFNANVYLNGDCSDEEFEEFLEGQVMYLDAVIAVNKIDQKTDAEVKRVIAEVEKMTGIRTVPISAEYMTNIDTLKETIFVSLGLIRIYLRPKGGIVDFERPLVLDQGSTVLDAAKKLNSKAAKDAICAYVTGPSAKFKSQRMGLEHELMDGDIVTIVYRK